MNANQELYSHILCEFNLHNENPILTETRGVVNNLNDVVSVLVNMCDKQIKNTIKDNCLYAETYYNQNMEILKDIDTFFRFFKLELYTEKSSKKTYKGGIKVTSVKKNKENNTFYIVPDIKLTITGNDEFELRYILAMALSHELTHGYNLLQYAIENDELPTENVSQNQKYENIQYYQNGFFSNNTQAVASILYNLNRMERNAYIAQTKEELLSNKDNIKDAKTLFDAIKKTESYKKFLYLNNNIIQICNIKDETTQKEILDIVNKIMEKKFTTYNQVKKYFINRLEKWKKKYLTVVSKIGYDIYNKYNFRLDNNFGNNNVNIEI